MPLILDFLYTYTTHREQNQAIIIVHVALTLNKLSSPETEDKFNWIKPDGIRLVFVWEKFNNWP